MSKEKQPKDPAKQGKEIKTAADLIQDENNYRKHSDTNKARIKKSIDEAGLGRSVVIDADGVLVAGNGVQQVIDKDTPVRVVETDGTELVVVKRTDLHTGDPRRKTLALADNATADDVEWNYEAIEADGWTEDEAGEWGVEWPEDEEESEQKEAHEDDFDPDKPVETVCKKGDIWKLGNHRLMCGDSTDAGSVALLMDGEKADICFTSPPYNMGGKNGSWASVPNIAMKAGQAYNEYTDDVSDEEYSKLLTNSCRNAIEHCDDVLFNIGVLSNSRKGIVAMLHELQDNFFEILTWKKTSCLPLGMKSQKGMVSHLCEPIFCFNKDGLRRFSHPQWQAGCGRNIIETQNASGNEYAKEHAATFPVEFAAEAIKMFCDNSVLDLFGGIGTTLIAAEQLNRKCYMMELDPHYCDVIIARWEKLTGNKAEKVNVGS